MRNEDYDRELFAAVTVICTMFAVGASALETTKLSVANSSVAKPSITKAVTQAPTRVDQLEPVRIIGTPFFPNTKPGVR
jgi:hypothetical protein